MILPAPAVAAILAPLILWRVYQRVRRLMVRQQSFAWRHWLSIGIMSALVIVFAVLGRRDLLAVAGLAGGVVAGIGLSWLALRRSQFEHVGADYFFVPHAPIGALVSLLFIGRLLYRGYQFYVYGPLDGASTTISPLTMIVFGVMAGYYANYARGILRWRADHKDITA